MGNSWNRRGFLGAGATAVGMSALVANIENRFGSADKAAGDVADQVNHSVCKWCYGGVSLEKLCEAGKEFGLQSVELLQPKDIPTVQKFGMTCAIISNPTGKTDKKIRVGGIGRAWNRLEHHKTLLEIYEQQIKESVKVGIRSIICFSGNRAGMDDKTGLKNCAIGLKKLMPIAEKHNVKIIMELLNSKSHKDYMCDHTKWGVDLCNEVGSESFGLLYDIYHMQRMEGDVIDTIKKYKEFIFHYHTGGVPGRGEIDETQELYYPAIIKAIVETGYRGFVGQEFIPKRRDKIASLKQGVEICRFKK